jgi:hypothetical protein
LLRGISQLDKNKSNISNMTQVNHATDDPFQRMLPQKQPRQNLVLGYMLNKNN